MTLVLSVSVVAAVLHVATRTWLILRYGWVGSDTYYHLIVGGLLRIRRRWPLRHDRFIRPEVVDYPPLLPLLSAIWPRKHLRQLQYLGPGSDFGTLLAVGVIALWLDGVWAASIAMMVYASTPYTFDMAYSLSPRPLANLFMTLSLGALLLVDELGVPAVVAAGLFGGLVLLTHRLTTQSYLAAAGAFAVFAPLEVLSAVAISVFAAITLSGGVYLSTLQGHLAFIRDIRNSPLHRGSPARDMAKVLAGNPHLVLVAFLVSSQWDALPDKSAVLALATVVIWVVAISWPYGEGDRHFANASTLTALTASLGVWSGGSSTLLAATVAAGTIIITTKLASYPELAKRGASTVVTAPIREACAMIRAETVAPTQPLVLTCPQSLSYQVMFFAHARGVVASGGTGTGLAYNVGLEIRLQQSGIPGLLDSEAPDYVVCLDRHRPSGLERGFIQIFDSGGTEVYRRSAKEIVRDGSSQQGPAGA